MTCVLAMVLYSGISQARSPTAAATGASVPTGNIQLVNITVLDGKGQPVTDLTTSDFKSRAIKKYGPRNLRGPLASAEAGIKVYSATLLDALLLAHLLGLKPILRAVIGV